MLGVIGGQLIGRPAAADIGVHGTPYDQAVTPSNTSCAKADRVIPR
jgi:hypothetical protein